MKIIPARNADRRTRRIDGAVRAAGIAVCATALSGCASIVSGGTYSVSVKSSVPGVRFTVRDSSTGERKFSGRTPTTVELESSSAFFESAQYIIESKDERFPKISRELGAQLNPWYFGNFLLPGGIVGFLIVDPLSGAMWKLPEEVYLTTGTPSPDVEKQSENKPIRTRRDNAPVKRSSSFVRRESPLSSGE